VSIPDYQSLMTPVLKVLDDSGVLTMRELAEHLGAELHLTDEDRRQTIQSGMGLLENRAHWAVTYLIDQRRSRRP
jgi:restriction system protein